MTTLYQYLIAAKAKIDHPDKWCQRQMQDGEGRLCAIGATHADGRLSKGSTIYALECALLLIKYYDGIVQYNDTHSHAEVMAIFDLAIATARPTNDAVKRIMEEALRTKEVRVEAE